jgi:hypothetical protein
MLMEIRNAGGRIFTMMGSQLPYTYVHLVSFVCHVFLWILASYFGFVLHAGIPQVHYDLVIHEVGVPGVPPGAPTPQLSGDVMSKRSGSMAVIEDDWWLFRVQIYVFIVFSNALVQGLLSMHALLENPFGVHPCKFPLRAYAIDHIRQTRAMLREPHEREPSTIRSIFTPPEGAVHAAHAPDAPHGGAGAPTKDSASSAAGGAAPGKGHIDDDGRAKGIHFVQQNSTQMHTDVQAPSNNASII